MVWFGVDDGFYTHPKALSVSLSALGIWTFAGSWCARYLTDGHIPESVLIRLSPSSPRQTKALAAELVAAGLWTTTGDGWQFHDWTVHQHSREIVEAKKALAKERQAKRRRNLRGEYAPDNVTDIRPGAANE